MIPPRALPAALLLALSVLTPARAETIAANYAVQVAGLTVMDLETVLEITDQGYALEFRSRLRGVAAALGGGASTTRVEGVWQGDAARPRRYVSEGTWRGEARRTVVEWPNGQPVVRVMVPPNTEERDPVPEADQRNTVDNLSAIALLVRRVRRNGRCDGTARVYDGRRLSELTARSGGQERFAPARDEWSGVATKCAVEGVYLAGYRRGEDVEAARRPQAGTAWLAGVGPGQPVMPVRVESTNRWFGTAVARLVSYGAPGATPARAGAN